jgi:rhamnogalacturonyl hydrolase YesR
MTPKITASFSLLKNVFESIPLEDRFKGHDPFDGLNSPLVKNTFLGKNRFIRLAWVQLFKRNPINLRKVAGIKKQENPQALAIFLAAYCQLYKLDKRKEYLESIHYLANRIVALRLDQWSGACWSYPFAWQARAFYQPGNTPLIIPTTYCFNALLDAYEITHVETYKTIALTTAKFVLDDLNRSGDKDCFAFSYSPEDHSVVYNASLMASQVLARSFKYTADTSYKEAALASVQFCVNAQNVNGSWTYGNKPFHQWIDNFHSGYNLVCLIDYSTYCNDVRFESIIEKGLTYYLETFFTEDGFSKYYNNNKFPLDNNNPAQLIITLAKANKIDTYKHLLSNVLENTIEQMQSSKGWFYYQKNKWFTNRIIYLRWSNSWMFYAFSLLAKNDNN